MISQATLAHIRYGYGFRPGQAGPTTPQDLLAQVIGPDPSDAQFPAPDIGDRIDRMVAYGDIRRKENTGRATEEEVAKVRDRMRAVVTTDFADALIRPMVSPRGFRERLVAFWADHFTVSAKNLRLATVVAAFRNEAIRPHVGGTFADMLIAASTHPAMLSYLDQNISIGPNSRVGKRRGQGLNENLAREILELHTLGVGAKYTQTDVREFAELLTGLMVDKNGFRFNPRIAEPGAETVLGATYGGARPRLEDIHGALANIARRPDTAHHLARKLATHFVSDTPDADHVAHVAAAYTRNEGNLLATYAAMLEHPAAWSERLTKVKQPWDLVVSALRALGIDRQTIGKLTTRDLRRGLSAPLLAMGQQPFRPPGPDGWPEEASAWITPATLTARLDWLSALARRFAGDTDPRTFVQTALGDAATDTLRFAAQGAEKKWEGVALVLASPEFNRR